MIPLVIYRMRIGLHYSRQAKAKGIEPLNYFDILIIMSLLLISGIERNPGPSSTPSSSSESSFTPAEDQIINNKFSVVHYNVQSIVNKLDLLEVELQNFDVICITETWLDQRTSDEDLNLNGYKLFRRDRLGENYGGICVYVRNNTYSCRRNDLELPNIECIWIELRINGKKQLIGTFYRPPNSTNAVWSSIEDSIGQAFDTNIRNILVTGDFNFDILKQPANKKIKDICQQFSLFQLINEPTNYTESSSSIIDLFLTGNKNNILLSGVGEPFLDQNIRYHCPIYCVLNFKKVITPVYSRKIYLYSQGNYEAFSKDLEETDWQSLKNNDINIYAENITDKICQLANKHIPNKIIKVRQSDPSWLSNDIKRLIRKKKRLYDKYKRTNRTNDFENYKQTRNRLTNEIRKSKNDDIRKLANRLENTNVGPKDWWKTLKQIIKPEQTSTIPPLKQGSTIYSSECEKAEALNKYFTQQTELDESNAVLPQTANAPQNKLESIVPLPEEVESILRALQTGKAAGPDFINNRLLKELARPLSFPLSELFNLSISMGEIPGIWKQANVTPIYKKNDPSDVTNYRPISLLSTIGKVLEKIIHKHVFNFFRDHHIITAMQSGFIPGDSTVNQLVVIYNTFCKALDEGKEVRAIFCDISKAFDRVWHKGLIFKLERAGITGSLLQWFTNYLDNRKQRVVLPGASSEWTSIKAGVPQGSILGPLLFLLYINDIVEDINSSIRLFADDTSLYVIVEKPDQAAHQLNSDLSKVHQWATKWLVTFNPAKSESITFTRKRHKPFHPPVLMNQTQINEVGSHKHLGLIFTSDCTWHEHLEYIKSKAWTRINVMRKHKFILDRKSLQTIYISFIRPLLEYADVVWDNCTQYEVNELEKIQNEAARIVTGATKLVSIDALRSETGWETLSSRRKKHKLQMFFKMKNGLAPNYLSSLVPPSVGNTSAYQLRNALNISTVHASSQLYYNSFLPSVIRDWNDLPDEVRNSTSSDSFKRKLNANVGTPPKYYLFGNRLGQIYHARLRTNCSALNQHLFSKNIVDNPLCVCGSIEDTHHFMFICNRYGNHRQTLLDTVSMFCRPTLNLLLFGSSELSLIQNKQVFLAVQDFLLKTKRFEIH
ncbi:MAG: reverse transcriptase domain-containing protein [Candidatus Thiodiazotropha taylori]|nr:endonuclease/exonuclease/phosphatase family protein [Candidatus Thiodiazotropha taylori]MCW4285391.1 reverse transcriptase domain-containing protein [Candidatus Thiodiazotropha taylori]